MPHFSNLPVFYIMFLYFMFCSLIWLYLYNLTPINGFMLSNKKFLNFSFLRFWHFSLRLNS